MNDCDHEKNHVWKVNLVFTGMRDNWGTTYDVTIIDSGCVKLEMETYREGGNSQIHTHLCTEDDSCWTWDEFCDKYPDISDDIKVWLRDHKFPFPTVETTRRRKTGDES